MTWQVVGLLQRRCPALRWNPGRVALVLADHPHPTPLAIAGRCADWIAFEARRVDDGHRTLRTFFERAMREIEDDDRQPPPSPDLGAYDIFLN